VTAETEQTFEMLRRKLLRWQDEVEKFDHKLRERTKTLTLSFLYFVIFAGRLDVTRKKNVILLQIYNKVSLCENCQRQSCKAFIGLTNCAKIIGWGDPLYLKFWIKVTAFVQNCRFSIYFHS